MRTNGTVRRFRIRPSNARTPTLTLSSPPELKPWPSPRTFASVSPSTPFWVAMTFFASAFIICATDDDAPASSSQPGKRHLKKNKIKIKTQL